MRIKNRLHVVGIALLAFVFSLGAIALLNELLRGNQLPIVERVKSAGRLIVATRRDPAVYFEGIAGPDGFEVALVRRFADHLGVDVRFVFPRSVAELLDWTASGKVHMASAGLSVNCERKRLVRFSLPYDFVTAQLIYRRGSGRPTSIEQVAPGELRVVAGSSHEQTLSALRRDVYPDLIWQRTTEIDQRHLLQAVDEGALRYTIADDTTAAMSQRLFRHAVPAFDLGDEEAIAWAFPRHTEDSLFRAANTFLEGMHADGELEYLRARYFGHIGRLNFVETRAFWRAVRDRLPELRAYFVEASEITGIDWRLLAAVGYQESHWREDAVSPTGVRGIMMLTRDTARQLGIDDRIDARESILGGAQYLRLIEDKLPERIGEPNRLWLTLAGYNVGFGHLEDARVLVERDNGNPDLWVEVKQRLPLLAKKAVYETLRYGYARGQEPVNYVDNIRNYYDMLVWFTNTADEQTRKLLLAKSDD